MWAAPKAGEVERADEEEVEFPGGLYEVLEGALVDSQKVVPVSARRFQGWDVGLLERFDVDVMAGVGDGDGIAPSGAAEAEAEAEARE